MEFNSILLIGVSSGVAALATAVYFIRSKIQRKRRRAAYPRDKVILHQFARGLHAPSASPFVLKLETWLRMAGVPYQNDHRSEFSKKGQMPWITYNQEDVADSQFCIEFLSKKFDIDLNQNLNAEQRAIGRAFFKMTEESLKWQVGIRRYVFNAYDTTEAGIPKWFTWLVKGKVHQAAWLQGYGRHSQEEVVQIGKDDLKSIDVYIDHKKFIMGNSVCDLDATLFGFLAQFVYHDNGPLNKFLKDECPNLVRYVATIKETYWKDWDQAVRRKN